MRKNGFNRIMALVLTAGITLSQSVVAMAGEGSATDDHILLVSGDENAESQDPMASVRYDEEHKAFSGNETRDASDLAAASGTAASDISDISDSIDSPGISAAGDTDTTALSAINNPQTKTEGGTTYSTWDCIWFGNYWQEDTNGDGYCFEKETIVSLKDKRYLVDQDGASIYDSIPVGTYYADDKQPIKWRVLDIDKETGEALLLSDKLIDIVQYNEVKTGVTLEDLHPEIIPELL